MAYNSYHLYSLSLSTQEKTPICNNMIYSGTEAVNTVNQIAYLCHRLKNTSMHNTEFCEEKFPHSRYMFA